MARQKNNSTGSNGSSANLGFEAKLWLTADKLRNNMDAAEYKHVVLGLIFLKYISDTFEEHRAKLVAGQGDYAGSNPEDADEYKAENVFWVPAEARWAHLQASAKQPTIGKIVDDAMVAIERDNPRLKGVLPKDYARPGLDKQRLGELIDVIATIELTAASEGEKTHRSVDLLGRVYEYFLTRFASAEGKNGGQFYTPSCVVRTLVEMLAPYKGRIYDPACGSGGMFVQSEKFVESHGGKLGDISIYGQESNATTRRLAVMNLALRGIEADFGPEHADSFRRDLHPDLRADYVLANPPFNDSDWFRKDDDVRWRYGVPPKGNANFAWVQHFIHHLAPNGYAGFVLANGSMSSNQSGEGDIRKALIEADLVDCMVALPGQLFYSTQIPVCLWFIARNKSGQPSPGASRHPLPEGEGHYRGGFDFSGQIKLARELRQKATPTEQVFWELVRDRRFLNLKFRRQHQIGDYIADFYCDENKLVVELDGLVHATDKRRPVDAKRDAYMKSLGLTVLRVSNDELLDHTDQVLNNMASLVAPSPTGRGPGVRVNRLRDRKGEVLFIDARKLGTLIDRVHRELTDADINKITSTYHAWRRAGAQVPQRPGMAESGRGDKQTSPLPHAGEGKGGGNSYSDIPGAVTAMDGGNAGTAGAGAGQISHYQDVAGFCKSASLEEIAAHGYVLTPGRYVGAEEVEDDGEPFEEKMPRLIAELNSQFEESAKLELAIKANMKRLGYDAR